MDNDYLAVLDFLKAHGGERYMAPRRAKTQAERDELTTLRDIAKYAIRTMHTICEHCASCIDHHLIIANSKIWLRGDNQVIRDYFWVQLKREDSKERPISISIFAEYRLSTEPFYRISLELEEKKVNHEDYLAYKRYSDLPLSNRFRYYVLQDASNHSWRFCDEAQNHITQMHSSDNINERVQPSYYIPRINHATNADRTAEEFEAQFLEGLRLLIPYYDHVLGCY